MNGFVVLFCFFQSPKSGIKKRLFRLGWGVSGSRKSRGLIELY